jgi:hypothetical protein
MAAFVYLASVFPAVIQKLFAALNVAQGQTAKEAAVIGAEMATQGHEIDIPALFVEMQKGAKWPQSAMMRRSFKRAQTGDLAAPGRWMRDHVGWQIILLAAQLSLTLISAGVLIAGIDTR